jgi:alpha-glucosidase (family GH31 glycosyl hydrolase)
VNTGKQFNMNILDGKEILMSTVNQSFIMMQHYKEVGFRIPKTTRFMGLGERNGPLFLKEGTYTLFAEQRDFSYDMGYGEPQGYGYHPLLMLQRGDGRFFSVYFLQHTSMSVTIRRDPNNTADSLITIRTIGENFDMYVNPGPTWGDMIYQYQNS